MLASARELPLADVMSFVTQSWNVTPQRRSATWALSAGRRLIDQRAGLQLEAYPLWCEESPRECDDAILAEAVKPDPPLIANIILLLKESEHPELDASLNASGCGRHAERPPGGAKDRRIAAAGREPESATRRKEALAQLAGSAAIASSAYLVNYLVRFAPKDAAQFLRAAFQDKESSADGLDFRPDTLQRRPDPDRYRGPGQPQCQHRG